MHAPSVYAYNARLPLATYYQINGDAYPVVSDSDNHFALEVEPEHADSQPVLSSPDCSIVISAGMVRRAKVAGGAIRFEDGSDLVFLAPIP